MQQGNYNASTFPILNVVLNIPTKINKGTVEIITPVELIKKGDKVDSFEAALLAKLGIKPFSYGFVVLIVYNNGTVFSILRVKSHEPDWLLEANPDMNMDIGGFWATPMAKDDNGTPITQGATS